MAKDHPCVGFELDLFAQVTNWNAYIKSEIGRYIKGHVLEVGAGIGGITSIFFSGREESWTCLEPDKDLFHRLTKSLDNSPFKKKANFLKLSRVTSIILPLTANLIQFSILMF